MAMKIDPKKIAAGELSDSEVKYLSDRGRLPANYFGEPEAEAQETPTIGDNGGIVDDEDGEEEDYLEGWNNEQRRTELARRKLSIEGRKDDLISRLRRSDHEDLNDDDYSTIEDE